MEYLCGQYFLNSDLRADEIRQHIRELCNAGYETIFLHARAGLKTPYLSQDWFDALDVAVDELVSSGMKFAIWDEDNFPSGDAGNRICCSYPEFASSRLEFQISEVKAGQKTIKYFSSGSAFAGCFAVYKDGTLCNLKDHCGTLRESWQKSRIQSSAYSATATLPYPHRRRAMETPRYAVLWTPDQDCRLVCIECIHSTPGNHSGDLLNPEATQTLIDLTHAEYERRFKNKMKYCSASFMDEPGPAGDYPWTRHFPEEFFKDHGYDLTELLPHIGMNIDETSVKIRNDYRKTLHRLLCQSYLEPVKNWLNVRNIDSTGHLTRSENISWSAFSWPNQLRCFKYLDIPCCDPLGTGVGEIGASAHHIGIKLVSSAARLFGKKAAGADAFAVGGDTVSLSDLTFILNYSLVMGITWFNVHGLYYTLEGERRDEAPPSLFVQHSQWPHMKTFLNYLKKRCDQLNGVHVCNLELLYPATALQSSLPEELYPAEALHLTAEKLLSHQRDFELIDEVTLSEQNPSDFVRLRPYFLVAYASVIERNTALWLKRYAAVGGTLLITGIIPQILSGNDSENTEFRSFFEKHFCTDFCDKICGVALSGKNVEQILIRQICKDNEIRTFLFNRGNQTFRGNFAGTDIEIAPGEGGFADELSVKNNFPELEISSWKLKFSSNSVPLYYWESSSLKAFDLLSKNNTGLYPVAESGDYYAVFTIDSPLEKVFFTTEEEILECMEFFLNGTPLNNYRKADFRDCREVECEITSLLKTGRNILTCCGELMKNPPYLRGNFKVRFPLGNCGYPVLSSAPEVFELAMPKDFRNLGYGSFSGTAVYEGKTNVGKSGVYSLKLDTEKDSVKIFVDGKEYGTLFTPPYQLELELNFGEHDIRLELCNASGNRDILAGVPAGLQS